MLFDDSREFALKCDNSLVSYRNEFIIPKKIVDGTERETIYFCGNSLGLQPKHTRQLLNEELNVWEKRGVDGHFDHDYGRPWVSIDDHVNEQSAALVGAKVSEVCVMNSLTVNLHLMMVTFYKPVGKRCKILMEGKAFPSDYFAIESQVKFHGYNPNDVIIQQAPREGESTLRTEDILETIRREGDSIALVLFSGVQYFTGQKFEMDKITSTAQEQGCKVGWDLAHAVGNVHLELHDWGVDFAVWCSYKYLNSGPGGIAGAFVHEKHSDPKLPRFAGWWGADPAKKFDMELDFVGLPGAMGYRLSNPCVLAVVSMKASLDIFKNFKMVDYYEKVTSMSTYFRNLLMHKVSSNEIRIISPEDPKQRGCQLSLLFLKDGRMEQIFQKLTEKGVICDRRKPDVIRVAAIPLYNKYEEIWEFVNILVQVLGNQ